MKITSFKDNVIGRPRSVKTRAYIEIVRSTNPRLNAMAADSRLTIMTALRKRYTKVRITIVNDMADLDILVAKNPDLVVLGMKLILTEPEKGYEDSQKVWLSEYLGQHGINFTGSETEALTLEFDKQYAKQRVIESGLASSAYFMSPLIHPYFQHSLNFPLFVKPSNRGDSKGIDEQSVVSNDVELKAKIRSIHDDCGSDALIEEYLPGREFSVGVIRQAGSNKLVAMPVEILPDEDRNGNRFLSSAIKNADTEQVLPVHQKLKESLGELAIGVFKALGSRDYGRIDMRLNALGKPSFIEANLMPGLSNHGYLSKCFAINDDIGYEEMIFKVVALGIERMTIPVELDQVLSDVFVETVDAN
jgi:D-alanine-D-alanine ligase